MCGQQLGVTGYGQYAKYWPLLELWTGGQGAMGGDSALFHPLPVIPHKAQMPLPPIQPTLLYYAVANTPIMQPLCSMGALIPMPPTRLMPPASTNCAVCHFRGMCLAYPAYPISNPPTATCLALIAILCVTSTLLLKALPLLSGPSFGCVFFQLGVKVCLFCIWN